MEEKTINKYKFTFNENGYIISGGAVLDDNYDWIGQMADYKEPSLDYGCYKLVNGNIVKDEQEYQRLKHIHDLESERDDLKQKLADTDYIWNVIKEGDHEESYYADVIADRHTWRLRVREIEEELGL